MRTIVLSTSILLAVLTLSASAQALRIERIGSALDLWSTAINLDVQGDYAYVCTGKTGLRVVDVSNPEEPLEIGFVNTAGFSDRAFAQDTLVYLADNHNGLRIINVADPENPTEVGSFVTGESVRDVAVAGDFAYIADFTNGLKILDVSDPTQPEQVGFHAAPRNPTLLEVQGDYAYVMDLWDGMDVMDISDPENPIHTGHFDMDRVITDLAVSGDVAAIIRGNRLYVADISNPEEPVITGNADFYRTGSHVCIQDQFAYGTQRDQVHNHVYVFNLSDPEDPQFVGNRQIRNGYGITVLDDMLYIADGAHGLVTYSIREPGRLGGEVGRFDPGYAQAIAVQNDYAYVGVSEEKLSVLDISDPRNPQEVATVPFNRKIKDIFVRNDLAFVLGRSLHCNDVSDPSNPEQLSEFRPNNGGIKDFVVVDGLVYFAMNDDGFWIADYSDPQSPEILGSNEELYDVFAVAVKDTVAFVSVWGSRILAIDIRNPEELEIIGSVNAIGADDNIIIAGDYLYVMSHTQGVRIIDISDPENMSEVCLHDTPGSAMSAEIEEDHLFLADWDGGIRVLNISDPHNPEETGYHDCEGYADRVAVQNGIAYVAMWYGVEIYNCRDALKVETDKGSTPPDVLALDSYPNPFNSTTTISYNIPSATNVSLELFNLLGQRVMTLFEGQRQAGVHNVILTADDLPSGLYFVRLSNIHQSSTQKVMLVK